MTRTPGRRLLDRRRDAARQPTATDRDEDDGQVRQVLRDLEPDGSLAGDDPVVVERRDDRQPTLRGDLLGDPLPFVAGSADHDDLGAVGGHAVALHRRRIGWHHDHGRGAQQARGASDALGVIAR